MDAILWKQGHPFLSFGRGSDVGKGEAGTGLLSLLGEVQMLGKGRFTGAERGNQENTRKFPAG